MVNENMYYRAKLKEQKKYSPSAAQSIKYTRPQEPSGRSKRHQIWGGGECLFTYQSCGKFMCE